MVRLLGRTLVSVAAMEGSVLVEALTGQRSSALMGNAVCWLELCAAAHRFRWFHALVMASMTFGVAVLRRAVMLQVSLALTLWPVLKKIAQQLPVCPR